MFKVLKNRNRNTILISNSIILILCCLMSYIRDRRFSSSIKRCTVRFGLELPSPVSFQDFSRSANCLKLGLSWQQPSPVPRSRPSFSSSLPWSARLRQFLFNSSQSRLENNKHLIKLIQSVVRLVKFKIGALSDLRQFLIDSESHPCSLTHPLCLSLSQYFSLPLALSLSL